MSSSPMPSVGFCPRSSTSTKASARRSRPQSSRQVTFHTEFLDLDGGREARYEEKLLELLRLKYAGVKLDLIVSGTSRALRFLLAHRDDLFPGVPIVFTAVEKKTGVDLVLPSDVTGMWVEIDWRGTLEAALQLQPETGRVVVVGGTTDIDRLWIRRAREAFSAYKGGVEFTYLTDLPMGQLLKKVAGLPDGTIILFFSLLRDGAGHDFIPQEVLSRLSAAARVPIYGPSETQIGAGAVGGRVTSYRAQGIKAAELGLRALRGRPAGPADIVEAETVLMFDWRQLERWGLSEHRLPAGSKLLYRPLILMGSLQVADRRNRGDRAGGGASDRGPADSALAAEAGGVGARRAPAVRDASGRPVSHPEPSPRGRSGAADRPGTPAPRRGARGRPVQPGRGGSRHGPGAVHALMGAGRRCSRAVGRREGRIPVDGQARAAGAHRLLRAAR